MSSFNTFNIVTCYSRSRGKLNLLFQKVWVKHKVEESEGKITIFVPNRGKNAIAPTF
jgi:hypothetical protein